MQKLLENVFNQFQIHSEFQSYEELNSGHINDTYLITTQQKPYYILQRINGNVFPKSKELIANKVLVSNYLQTKLVNIPVNKISKKVLSFVKSKDGTFFYKDNNKDFWNVSIFIPNTITYLKTPNKKIAYEAGKITGQFLEQTKEFKCSELTVILPNFHSVSKRYQQFINAKEKAQKVKLKVAKEYVDFVDFHINEMKTIDFAIEKNILQKRLTHCDTKISNILFSKSNKALCLIDTDTVMEGVLHFDYGDAIRTICNTKDEDSKEIKEIDFNIEYFKSYTKGFVEELKHISNTEFNLLPISIKMMPFIMGLRFLTDYLNDDIYFKTKYATHNLDRAINQFTLVEKINKKYPEIKDYFKQLEEVKF